MPDSPYLKAIAVDNSIPIEPAAVDLWMKDSSNKLKWVVLPLLQFIFAALLHIIWLLKRLPLPQFKAHRLLQKLICWFSKNFVSYEANLLILRHFSTESNILNFLAENTAAMNHSDKPAPLKLYPLKIDDMMQDSFVKHDQELFRMIAELGHWKKPEQALSKEKISWQNWQTINMDNFQVEKKPTQILDFATAHVLFMCLFCLLLTRQEYSDAINGFKLDQSIAIRIGQLVDDPTLVEMAYNKYPLYQVGPWDLTQRFLMHGFFTEYLYAYLEEIRLKE
jgi:hypothetical protein